MVAGPVMGRYVLNKTQGLGHRTDFLSTGSLVPFRETGVHGGAVRRSQELSHQNQGFVGVGTACFLAGPFPKSRPGTRAALADAQGCLWKGKWSSFYQLELPSCSPPTFLPPCPPHLHRCHYFPNTWTRVLASDLSSPGPWP